MQKILCSVLGLTALLVFSGCQPLDGQPTQNVVLSPSRAEQFEPAQTKYRTAPPVKSTFTNQPASRSTPKAEAQANDPSNLQSFSWGTWVTLIAIAAVAIDKTNHAFEMANQINVPMSALVSCTVASIGWESAKILAEGSIIMGVLGMFIGDDAGSWLTTIGSELFAWIFK